MTFRTLARRVRDTERPLGWRQGALRSAVGRYRHLGFELTWAFITGTDPGARTRLDEAGLLAALETVEASRAAWLVETDAFARRRKAQKREARLPVDPAEMRYRNGPRWPGPRAHEAAVFGVAASRGPRPAPHPVPQVRSLVEPLEAELDPIVDAYLGAGLGPADRRRLRDLLDRIEAVDAGLRRDLGLWGSVMEVRRVAELIGNDALPLVRRGWIGDAASVTEIFWAARGGMTYLPALHTYDETAWWVEEVMIPAAELWIAERHGVPVGFAALGGDWLDHLYVSPAAQGHGVGEALLAKAKRRRKALDLHVFEQNTGAQAFYERHGFSLLGKSDGRGNEEKLPDRHMLWRR
ncbi:GNAT family N-acetyltransferase [Glycomyces harbinensis]|uniref:Acetyltransferase (GNAT) domain-containing protein n=1 Tax=Glycomyces harbinensis TaxID=58114 RepID=A0A1G7C3M9_9ACTN|nr:GNAT family N-acetyltransferase [Glycomyces harbinensis]SDE33918.1 Acetyltransferase (GNAT) domain-containing protein [Glycomyces harbinensis]